MNSDPPTRFKGGEKVVYTDWLGIRSYGVVTDATMPSNPLVQFTNDREPIRMWPGALALRETETP